MVKAIVGIGNSIHISRRYAPWVIEPSISGQRPFVQFNLTLPRWTSKLKKL